MDLSSAFATLPAGSGHAGGTTLLGRGRRSSRSGPRTWSPRTRFDTPNQEDISPGGATATYVIYPVDLAPTVTAALQLRPEVRQSRRSSSFSGPGRV